MGSRVDNSRGAGGPQFPEAARRASSGWPGGSEAAKAAVLLAAVFAAPALADTSGGFPDYVLQKDGTVLIDGDGATDCRSFALALEQGYFESGDISPGAQRVLEQCEEAGLLYSEGATLSASAGETTSTSANALPSTGASAVGGEGRGLPETGGPALPALLVVSSVVVVSGLLVRRIVG